MDYTRIFTLSSALIVAASVFGGSAEARKLSLDQCMGDSPYKAECACETALQKGTQKALRDFLKSYRNADTACNALASTVEFTENSNGGPPGSSDGPPDGNGGPPGTSGGSVGSNNGHGNGDQDAPGNSGDHDNAENSEHSGEGNSGNNGGNGKNH